MLKKKIPEVKCAHEERLRCPIPLCGWTPGGVVFQSSSLQGFGMFTIRENAPDWINRHGSGDWIPLPSLESRLYKAHISWWYRPDGRSQEKGEGKRSPLLSKRRERHRYPTPSQSGFPLCWADKGQLVTLAGRWAEELANCLWAKTSLQEGERWSQSIPPSDAGIYPQGLPYLFW